MKKKKPLHPLSWSIRRHLNEWSNKLIMKALEKNKAEYSKRNLRNIVPGKCNDDCPINPDRLIPWPTEIVNCEYFEKDGYWCKLKRKSDGEGA